MGIDVGRSLCGLISVSENVLFFKDMYSAGFMPLYLTQRMFFEHGTTYGVLKQYKLLSIRALSKWGISSFPVLRIGTSFSKEHAHLFRGG